VLPRSLHQGSTHPHSRGYRKAATSPRLRWTEGPFTTEARARESLQWQFAVPVIEKAVSV